MASLAHLLLVAAALCALLASAHSAIAADDIPVAVVLEGSKDTFEANEVSDGDIKRPPVDLRNPGPPQRQEHETQNPEYFPEQVMKLISIKENIENTELLLRQGFQGVANNIQNWISNNEQLNVIQQNIQNLQETFTNQIQKLNETLQGFISPQSPPPYDLVNEESQIQRDFRTIESRIKSLTDNFRSGLNTLSEGVHIVASLNSHNEKLRQSNDGADVNPAQPAQPAPAPAPPANPPQNILVQYAEMVQEQVSHGFGNVTQAIGNFLTNNPVAVFFNRNASSTIAPAPAGALADTPEATSSRPPWQNWPINFGNLFGGNQGSQGSTPGQSQGIFQGLNQIILQNPFANLGQIFSRPPSSSPPKPAEESPAGSNAVPEPAKPDELAPAPAAVPAAAEGQAAAPDTANADAPVTLPPQPVGPIRQILSNIPVVQRIQNSIQQASNPDRPRDTVKSENIDTKGHYGGNNGGDNNNVSSSGLKSEPSPSEEVPKETEQSEPIKQEPQMPAVSDKTE